MEVCNGDATITDVRLLDGLLEKARGLMFREEGRALLTFSYDDRHGVWMPFMRFSLDLAFVDAEKRIVDMRRGVPPMSLHPWTWKIYRPDRMCRHVLEVEAGLLDEKGFEEGQELTF